MRPRGDDGRPDHLLRWLEDARSWALRELQARLGPELPHRSARQGRLLLRIPPGGARHVELAELAGVTKQALGQMLSALRAAGLVETDVDPSDGRARIVRRTAAGDRVAARIEVAVAEVERDALRRVGARRYDVMLETLRELGRGADDPA